MSDRDSSPAIRPTDARTIRKPQQARQQSRIETLGREIDALYQEELAQINARLKNMKVTRDNLQVKQAVVQQTTALQDATLDEIAAMSLEAFWQQESRYINQVLHRLMGQRRLVMVGGAVVGVVEVQRKRRRPH